MSVVTMKSLLESGVHFGHQTKRWNPKMARYIFSQRNGIHIIDLQKTSTCIVEAYEAARTIVKDGKSILFVGTKKQAQLVIETEAKRCGMPYVNNRWLGGMLTNFSTIKKSISTLKRIEKMESDGTFESLTKKEVSLLTKQKNKLEKNLGGIKDMKNLPGALFIIDTKKEAIAITEAKKLGIPVIAVVDTNCDPTDITYPIPGNDDAIRAISLFVEIISRAVIDADNETGNLQIVESLDEEETEETKEVETESVVFSTEEETDFSKFEDKKDENSEDEKGSTVVAGIELDDKTLYQD